MALLKYHKVGTTGTRVSVVINDSYYTTKDSPISLRSTSDCTTLFTVTGTDFSPIIYNLPIGDSVDVFKFKDGSCIKITKNNLVTQTWGGLFNYTQASCYIDYVNASGGVTRLRSGDLVLKAETKICPNYFVVGIDDDLKAGYFFCVANSPINGNGTMNGFGTKIDHIYGTNSANFMYNIFTGNGSEFDPDPWSNAGYAGIGGGDGTFDFTSDVIGLPSLPTIDAVSTGFLQLFTGGLPKILELSQYMWSTDFFDNVVKITANPIDIIMGLYMYPFNVPATSQRYVRAGNVITNISMGVPDSQTFEIDCGEFPVPNFYGAYLDYEPFTKCEIFLPYCGTFPLSMDDIAGETLNVKYRVDLLTGVCSAYVIINGTVKYTYTGTCAINIPISSRSFENVYNAVLGVVGSSFSGGSFSLPSIGSSAGAVTSGKNQIQRGGSCSGNAGYLGVQKPYLIFTIPRVAIPKGLNTYTGYPIFASYKLGDLKGYTEVEKIHIENMGQATKEEIDSITSLLERGVIL